MTGGTWTISESGKNGTVSITATGLEREIKKRVGKNDRQFIPWSSVQYVQHDRKTLKKDVVSVGVGGQVFEWKISNGADNFVNQVNAILAER